LLFDICRVFLKKSKSSEFSPLRSVWLPPPALVVVVSPHRLLILGGSGFLPEVDKNLLK
jgi:hypothetical protein